MKRVVLLSLCVVNSAYADRSAECESALVRWDQCDEVRYAVQHLSCLESRMWDVQQYCWSPAYRKVQDYEAKLSFLMDQIREKYTGVEAQSKSDLSDVKNRIAQLKIINEKYDALRVEYLDSIRAFIGYISRELLPGLDDVGQRLMEISESAESADDSATMASLIVLMSDTYSRHEMQINDALNRFSEIVVRADEIDSRYLNELKATVPDIDPDELRTFSGFRSPLMEEMVSLIDERGAAASASVSEILSHMRVKRDVLRFEEIGATLDEAFERAERLRAESDYLTLVNEPVSQFMMTYDSGFNGMGFQVPKLKAAESIIELAELCDSSVDEGWHTLGCNRIASVEQGARRAIEYSIPNAIAMGLQVIRMTGTPLDSESIARIEVALEEGATKEACLYYDTVLAEIAGS